MITSIMDDGQNLKLIITALEESSIVAKLDAQGRFTYVNKGLCELATKEQNHLLGQSLQVVASQEHSAQFFDHMLQSLKRGEKWQGELSCLSGEGSNYWIQLTIIPYCNEQGELYRCIVFGTDITGQKLTEIELRKKIVNLLEIENALDESSIVAITDRAGVITYVNDKFCEVSKYSQEELLGRTHRIVNSGYHPKSFFKQMWDTITAGEIWHGEVKNRAKDGTGYWMNTTIVPFLDEQKKPRQFISIRSDITDRVKAEEDLAERTEQLARMRDEAVHASNVKSQFLANMSHELRTPLNAIIGYSEMLREEAEELGDEIFVEDLSKISKAGNHLLALINDILDISKIEAGKMELHYEDCMLPQFMEDVVATMKSLIEENGNKLIYHYEYQNQEENMHIDVLKLRQILLNLLSNANKFTDKGIITLTVSFEARDGLGGYCFIVQDTGIGMSDMQMTKLFQPFTQADSSTTRKYGGTGLGLSISHRITKMLGGEIDVTSELGIGTIFTFWLPGSPKAHSYKHAGISGDSLLEPLGEIRSTAQVRDQKEKVNILLIDDELSNHYLMERYIARTGWSIAHAYHAIEGLQLMKTCRPDIVCLDIIMPEIDGWHVLSALKEDEETSQVPVVIWSMADDRQKGYMLGASEFLTKPSDRDRVIEVISKYIETD